MIRKFEKNDIDVYILKEDIVGFIGLNENHIEGIFVDSNNQCNGIGTSLLNKVKENKHNLTLSVYKKNDFMITDESIDKNTNEVEYIMNWNKFVILY